MSDRSPEVRKTPPTVYPSAGGQLTHGSKHGPEDGVEHGSRYGSTHAASISVSSSTGFWRRLLMFMGPGFLISVGYMDPGNWATDLAGGSRYGYTLLFAILISSLMAILLQSLSLRLGIASDRDLAQLCRERTPRWASFALWLLAEIAIAACDLAEVIGSAIALQLLFHLPLLAGVLVTGVDVLLILLLERRGFRTIEALVMVLIGTIAVLFSIEIVLARPEFAPMFHALFIPSKAMVSDPAMLYIAIGILGATVMPHNLYLHSWLAQMRDYPRTPEGKREAIRFSDLDSAAALTFAFFVNAAILVVAAAVFHRAGYTGVAEIEDAYRLLSPLLGVTGASALFAIALLASGQNSTLTGTLAGQVVMEGFLDLRMKPWLRRLVTRMTAIIPAVLVVLWYGEHGVAKLLLLSQVILSMQLSFAVIPLVKFTGNPEIMGRFVNPRWLHMLAWLVAVVIAALNAWLLVEAVRG